MHTAAHCKAIGIYARKQLMMLRFATCPLLLDDVSAIWYMHFSMRYGLAAKVSIYTVVHKNAAVNILQQLLQIFADFDNFCTILTSNKFRTLQYYNVSIHLVCATLQNQKASCFTWCWNFLRRNIKILTKFSWDVLVT